MFPLIKQLDITRYYDGIKWVKQNRYSSNIIWRLHIIQREKALRNVILQPDMVKILGENGYKLFRSRYSTNVYAQNLVRIFSELMNVRK